MTQSPLAAPPPWDAVADAYVDDVVPQLARFAEDALAMADVRAGARVLDVASGPGTLAFAAARRRAAVTAIDFSPRMVRKLVERRDDEKVAIDAKVADARSLPFADESFDAAFRCSR